MRKEVGLWYYHYDPEAAHQLLRALIVRDIANSPEHLQNTRDFSKFLYEIRMDYESDREAEQALPSKKKETEPCKANVVAQGSSDHQEIELGNDDGSAEWRTRLVSETLRVKKVICLPEDLDEYNYTAVKIYMNNGGNRDFLTQINIDDYLIKQYHHIVPRTAKWYEISFDKTLLQGKSRITVYIRVTDASETGNYLQIWGDQNTPTTHSVFNFDTTHDLSFDEGIQTGEYMIRLVLKK